jgi:uncharacterized protein
MSPPSSSPGAIRIVLGHGASGTAASMAPYVEGLRARGLAADAINLRRGKAEDAVGPSWAATEALIEAQGGPGTVELVVGGQSFGGRVASLLAADRPADVRALVCFSYPLHRPGSPETWDQRTAHWPRIACPVLLLSGEADPFARLGLLESAIGRLRTAELVTYPGLGHGLKPVLPDVLDRVAAFIHELGIDRR